MLSFFKKFFFYNSAAPCFDTLINCESIVYSFNGIKFPLHYVRYATKDILFSEDDIKYNLNLPSELSLRVSSHNRKFIKINNNICSFLTPAGLLEYFDKENFSILYYIYTEIVPMIENEHSDNNSISNSSGESISNVDGTLDKVNNILNTLEHISNSVYGYKGIYNDNLCNHPDKKLGVFVQDTTDGKSNVHIFGGSPNYYNKKKRKFKDITVPIYDDYHSNYLTAKKKVRSLLDKNFDIQKRSKKDTLLVNTNKETVVEFLKSQLGY